MYQVVLQEPETGVCINLQDADRVFLSVEPLGVEISVSVENPHEDSEEEASLKEALWKVTERRDTSSMEVSDLRKIGRRESKVQETVEPELCTTVRV